MPNDCWNHVVVKAPENHIRTILTTAFTEIPQWAVEFQQIGMEALVFRLWSRNNPAIEFMNNLWETYPQIWIKNSWKEEGGYAGVIVGKANNIQDLMWEEGCEEEWNVRFAPINNPPTPVFAAPPTPQSATSADSSFAPIT